MLYVVFSYNVNCTEQEIVNCVMIDIDDEMLMMNNTQESQTADDFVGFVLR